MTINVYSFDSKKVEEITDFLKKFFFNKSYTYEVISYKNMDVLMDDLKDGMHCDLLFLDTYANISHGISYAKTLRSFGFTGEIVIMADSIQFALDSYDMQYADYLLNPFSVTKLDFIMERFIKKFYTKTYSVKSYSKFINIPYNEIIYIESDNSRCILHTVNKKLYTIYGKRLSIIGAELDDKRFLRCHYSCIVNMDYIASADREFILTTGDIVNIRQRSLKSIKDAYLEYISFRGEKETDNG